MVPTKERNVQSIYLDYKGEGILLDCGEGTQRQITIAGLNAQKITTILISHWHGDHVSGLVGLLQTLGNFSTPDKTVHIWGPVGSKQYFHHLLHSCAFELQLHVELHEVDAPQLLTIIDASEYQIQTRNLEHSIPCLGYRFVKKPWRKIHRDKLEELHIRPGPQVAQLQAGHSIVLQGKTITPQEVSSLEPSRVVSFIFDTQLSQGCYDLAEEADVLVSEAVYLHNLEEKAEEYKHLTAYQVAQIASQSGVQHLVLTHFSQRYKDTSELTLEAQQLFEPVTSAYDFMTVELDF